MTLTKLKALLDELEDFAKYGNMNQLPAKKAVIKAQAVEKAINEKLDDLKKVLKEAIVSDIKQGVRKIVRGDQSGAFILGILKKKLQGNIYK